LIDSQYLAHLERTRNEYLSNAQGAIAKREFRKASELLWGAVTQQIKALAATRNIVIESHRDFFNFLRQLSAELQEKQLYDEFVDLNALHKNFYDETIPADAFPRFYEQAIRFIGRLDKLTRSPA